MLDGATGDGYFRSTPWTCGTIYEDVGSSRHFTAHIAFDITTCDMDITDVATFRNNPTSGIVTDVTTGDVRLMDIDIVIENANTGILVHVTIGDDEVSIVASQMYAMQGLSYM